MRRSPFLRFFFITRRAFSSTPMPGTCYNQVYLPASNVVEYSHATLQKLFLYYRSTFCSWFFLTLAIWCALQHAFAFFFSNSFLLPSIVRQTPLYLFFYLIEIVISEDFLMKNVFSDFSGTGFPHPGLIFYLIAYVYLFILCYFVC